MGEAKNEAHLSRLARARGAIGYIGFFVALTQTLVRRTASSRSCPIFCNLLQIVLYRQGALGARSADQARRERKIINLNKISIRASERGLKS